MKLIAKSVRISKEAGIALITTLLLLLLMSTLLVGFTLLLISDQQLSGANNDQVKTFYGAEAGMEQLTASLGNLFDLTYSPSKNQISALTTTPPTIAGIQFVRGDGSSGFNIQAAATDSSGNPAPTISTIKSGTYQGMTAMATEYILTVNARTAAGREVALKRTTQTVGIPMFQFGIFSDTDLSFFPGPVFNFGGRTHTNGNLFLASGNTLTLSDKVDAYKDVIRQYLSNGHPTSSGYTGTVQIITSPCQPPSPCTYRALAPSEGSLVGMAGTTAGTSNWGQISLGSTYYAGNLVNGPGTSAKPPNPTGAKLLNLGIVTIGSGATQNIDLIRRPVVGEANNVTAERYFAQASLRILLSDDPNDITNLPCVSANPPFDLSKIAIPPGVAGANWKAVGYYAPASSLYDMMVKLGVTPLPLAASGAAGGYNATAGRPDGYWLPQGAVPFVKPPNNPQYSVIRGFLKIDAQLAPYGNPCGAAQDVTLEVLSLGYVGRNINPVSQSLDAKNLNPMWLQNTTNMEYGAAPTLPNLPSATLGYQNGVPMAAGNFTGQAGTCMDPHPNAIIRLERIRDNPSSVAVTAGSITLKTPSISTVAQVCGVDPTTGGLLVGWTPQPTDFWPNTIFDTREGTLRDQAMSNSSTVAGTGPGALTTTVPPLPTLNGVMHYIEVDAQNLTKWFGGKIGTSGTLTYDSVVAPNDFLVYVSDRRGNYVPTGTIPGAWPPLSFTANETGEYGWDDIVNLGDPANGCPDNSLDAAEDIDAQKALFTYGANGAYVQNPGGGVTGANKLSLGQFGIFTGLAGTAIVNNSTTCTGVPSYASGTKIWPMMVAAIPNAARENPPLFFRRSWKLVNGNDLTAVGTCPTGSSCGLAFAAENPVYIQGDYNANSKGNNWNDPGVPASVAGDAVTLLSVQWNDVNSFSSPYSTAKRSGITTYYRTAIIGGSTLSFPQPSGMGQDYGTDGGVHNFLRYIEAWGGTLNYRGSIVNLYTSRQANGTFKCCNTVYSPPNRGYNFDITFLTPSLLPPRTPLFRDVNTTGFSQILTPGVYQ